MSFRVRVDSLEDWTKDSESQNTTAVASSNDMYRNNLFGASCTTAFDDKVVNPSNSTAMAGSRALFDNNIFDASDGTDSGGMSQPVSNHESAYAFPGPQAPQTSVNQPVAVTQDTLDPGSNSFDADDIAAPPSQGSDPPPSGLDGVYSAALAILNQRPYDLVIGSFEDIRPMLVRHKVARSQLEKEWLTKCLTTAVSVGHLKAIWASTIFGEDPRNNRVWLSHTHDDDSNHVSALVISTPTGYWTYVVSKGEQGKDKQEAVANWVNKMREVGEARARACLAAGNVK